MNAEDFDKELNGSIRSIELSVVGKGQDDHFKVRVLLELIISQLGLNIRVTFLWVVFLQSGSVNTR